ncbi:ribonuclease III family protein [Methanolobus psychrotolerans]|uniref:ribonuclease III family protein n=1 Tax=Methanolobus psychrotolerans TaxID=1874706 RepID=UPI000B91BFF2|nr:ribonuclease III domain-containing protein [Methanolobus psychrotolerans]
MLQDYLTASLNEFQDIIGVDFEDSSFLIEALTHSSLFSGLKSGTDQFKQIYGLRNANYEKLEFLGDSVLSLIIAEDSYKNEEIEEYAKTRGLKIENILTNVKTVLTSNENLIPVAHKLNLEKYIFHGDLRDIEDVYADVIEALIGAIYLDQGYPSAKMFVNRFFDIRSALGKTSYSNPKGAVKEICDRTFSTIEYIVIKEEGPDHNKWFTVELVIDDIAVSTGEGKNKKKAEAEAAEKYLLNL